jgi:hypothetical protein
MTKRRPPPELLGHSPAHSAATKVRRSLDRAVLAALAKGLIVYFDEVRQQGVPERFKLLLGTDLGEEGARKQNCDA